MGEVTEGITKFIAKIKFIDLPDEAASYVYVKSTDEALTDAYSRS